MDFMSNAFAHISGIIMTSTNTGVPHIDYFKLGFIAFISAMTYGIILMRKIKSTQKDNRKDEAESTLYIALKEQIDFLSKQVKDQAEALRLAIEQKDAFFKEFTELRLKTNFLQEEVAKLQNVKTQNEFLKKRLKEKDEKIKFLRDKYDKMVAVVVQELKIAKINEKKYKQAPYADLDNFSNYDVDYDI